MLLDGDSGVLLDALTPAHSGSRVQILATGLGRVRPAWPTGVAAPLQEPPRVIAPVRAYLNGTPLEVTRATLAPGYVGCLPGGDPPAFGGRYRVGRALHRGRRPGEQSGQN